jgi:hypothetical protein
MSNAQLNTLVGAHSEPLVDTASLMAEVLRLREENAKLARAKAKTGAIKLSAKGAVSVYGLGKWPVTLYKSQWDALIARVPEIQAFMSANQTLLATKPE